MNTNSTKWDPESLEKGPETTMAGNGQEISKEYGMSDWDDSDLLGDSHFFANNVPHSEAGIKVKPEPTDAGDSNNCTGQSEQQREFKSSKGPNYRRGCCLVCPDWWNEWKTMTDTCFLFSPSGK